ncbi:PspA/IM30 family protein [Paenibacillus sp. MMO-177]|uniref:PspA/IM30 family protein n=1 Tax=Paenibacillus sp. MMO-177 TaxID=3081289 RepID=UPI0030187C5A
MGLFSRLKHFFKAKPEEDQPVQILNAFIEFYSDKVHELSISLNKSKSECLLIKGRMKLHLVNMAIYREKAELESNLGNNDMAKQWLIQANSEELDYERLILEMERLHRSTSQLKDALSQLENKLFIATEMHKQFTLRLEAANSPLEMKTFSPSSLDTVKEKKFLAEAKAELINHTKDNTYFFRS